MVGKAYAYYYSQRKKEKKFYCLNQDYVYGHLMSDNFKKALKEFYPEAQIVGEDFHKLFNTDFAPYLTKIKASGAEVVFTGNWATDADNLLKQARAMGLNVVFAHIYMNNPTNLTEIGVKGTDNMVLASPYAADPPLFIGTGYAKYFNAMKAVYKNFKAPYNQPNYEYGWDPLSQEFNWLASVIERAKSVDPDKIVKVWEGCLPIRKRPCRGHEGLRSPGDSGHPCPRKCAPDQQKNYFNIPPYKYTDKFSFYGTSLMYRGQSPPWMDRN
jgi:ABC-type branched-subunit amino acid transport system substrate-binding protein